MVSDLEDRGRQVERAPNSEVKAVATGLWSLRQAFIANWVESRNEAGAQSVGISCPSDYNNSDATHLNGKP